MSVRKAETGDLSRIAEIFVFNNRVNYLPIFRDEAYSFGELQVVSAIDQHFAGALPKLYVFDDGLIRGFMQLHETEIEKLYVDPFFQNRGIGGALMDYAIRTAHSDRLWALEKNSRAIAFYRRYGFVPTGEKKPEEGTAEFLIRLRR